MSWPAYEPDLDATPEEAVWAALADPTRRRLLDDLSRRGPLTATELAPEYPLTRQGVVKHLVALSNAGLLEAERHGRDVRYRVVPIHLDGAAAWLAEVGARWDDRLAALRSRLGRAAAPGADNQGGRPGGNNQGGGPGGK